MQETSALYKSILNGNYFTEVKVSINNIEYGMDYLITMDRTASLFGDGDPSIGNAISMELNITMKNVSETLPALCKIQPFIRIVSESKALYFRGNVATVNDLPTVNKKGIYYGVIADGYYYAWNGTAWEKISSEWLKKGTFYLDKQEVDDLGVLTIHGFDIMAQGDIICFPEGSTVVWNDIPKQSIGQLANILFKDNTSLMYPNPHVDQRTYDIIENQLYSAYRVVFPGIGKDSRQIREVLGYMAAMYCCNVVITDDEKIRFVPLKIVGGN